MSLSHRCTSRPLEGHPRSARVGSHRLAWGKTSRALQHLTDPTQGRHIYMNGRFGRLRRFSIIFCLHICCLGRGRRCGSVPYCLNSSTPHLLRGSSFCRRANKLQNRQIQLGSRSIQSKQLSTILTKKVSKTTRITKNLHFCSLHNEL